MIKMTLTKEQLAEWAQREKEYYDDAEKWKRVEERMKREHAEHIAEWKRKDIELEKIKSIQNFPIYSKNRIWLPIF